MKVFVIAIFCCVMGFDASTIQKNSETSKPCRTSDDCSIDECCIIRGGIGFMPGRCRTLEKEGNMCSSKTAYLGYYGDKYWKYCPCEQGLSCEVDEPKKALENATIFDIYNICLTQIEVEIISRDREEEIEDKNTSPNELST